MSKKAFTLVELMVVIAIVALLAGIALPMYSTYKQKSRVGMVLNSAGGVMRELQAWYEMEQTFSGIDISDPTGGALRQGIVRVGVGLPEIENVEWSISSTDTDTIRITWVFSHGCPSICNGYYEMRCDVIESVCYMSILLDAGNTLGYNK